MSDVARQRRRSTIAELNVAVAENVKISSLIQVATIPACSVQTGCFNERMRSVPASKIRAFTACSWAARFVALFAFQCTMVRLQYASCTWRESSFPNKLVVFCCCC